MKAELTPEQRETLFRAGDHDPLYCDCYEWEPEDEEPEQFCEALENTFETVAAMLAAAKAEALRETADAWATGAWNDCFLADDVNDDVSAVRSMAKFLTDRADQIEGQR